MNETFWERVNTGAPHTCWYWTGLLSPTGYGRVQMHGHASRQAHRVAWELVNGPIPDGLHVCHTCDTPACVNPAHLFLGAHADNMHDMRDKGRRKGKHRGSAHARTHLTERDIQIIRVLAGIGCTHKEIAERYAVKEPAVWKIVHRKAWQHVTEYTL
jgi:hypothetical protein